MSCETIYYFRSRETTNDTIQRKRNHFLTFFKDTNHHHASVSVTPTMMMSTTTPTLDIHRIFWRLRRAQKVEWRMKALSEWTPPPHTNYCYYYCSLELINPMNINSYCLLLKVEIEISSLDILDQSS